MHSLTATPQAKQCKGNLTSTRKLSRASTSASIAAPPLYHFMRTLASSLQMTGKGLLLNVSVLSLSRL